MSINFGLQIHCSWFKLHDLWHRNVENGANLGAKNPLKSIITITSMKRFLVGSNKCHMHH